jgi:hypothetical protein
MNNGRKKERERRGREQDRGGKRLTQGLLGILCEHLYYFLGGIPRSSGN